MSLNIFLRAEKIFFSYISEKAQGGKGVEVGGGMIHFEIDTLTKCFFFHILYIQTNKQRYKNKYTISFLRREQQELLHKKKKRVKATHATSN